MAARAEYAPEQNPEPEGTEGNSSHAGNSPSCRSCGLAPRTQSPSGCASPRGPWLAASAVSLLPDAELLSPQRLWRFHFELLGLRLVRSCHLRTLTVVWLCRASRPSARWPRPSARPRPLSTKPRLSELRPIRDSGPSPLALRASEVPSLQDLIYYVPLTSSAPRRLLVRQSVGHSKRGVLAAFSAASASVQRGPGTESLTRPGVGKMIHSLFLINCSGDIFLEKHWKSVVSQSVCDYFFEAQEKAADVENVPPVISTPHHYLISIYRDKLFFVSVIQTEVPPLFVIEFLHRVADTFQDYFGECSEAAIKDNVVIVYELLEEMLDNGFPLATESNILKELIKPPTILRSVVNSITGSSNVGDTLPTGQLSNIPWRRAGVKYTNNEAYFDVVEEIDAIIDKSGSTVFAEIQGVIDACIKLSGMPDLSLSFMNPRLLDDVSFHPCIRFKRWESERVLSFIPPDGNFRLISYRVSSQNLVAIPVYVKHNISFKENSSCGRFDITIGPKQNMGKTIEGITVTVHMPKVVLNMNLTPTQGSYTFDPVTKVLAWDVGKITPQKLPSLKGLVNLQSGAPKPEENPNLNIQFKIQQLAISGLKVNRLDMYGEKYKPFKGVKYITKAGKFQVRT